MWTWQADIRSMLTSLLRQPRGDFYCPCKTPGAMWKGPDYSPFPSTANTSQHHRTARVGAELLDSCSSLLQRSAPVNPLNTEPNTLEVLLDQV